MRRVILILLALIVLVPSMAQATAWYRCALDGETRSACCCPPKAQHHEAPASTELRAACCCKITLRKAPSSSLRVAPPAAIDLTTVGVPVAIVSSPIEAPIRVVTIEHVGTPRGPPEPLFVRHCSLLL